MVYFDSGPVALIDNSARRDLLVKDTILMMETICNLKSIDAGQKFEESMIKLVQSLTDEEQAMVVKEFADRPSTVARFLKFSKQRLASPKRGIFMG